MIRIQGYRVLTSIQGHQEDIEQEQSMLAEASMSIEEVESMLDKEYRERVKLESEITKEWYDRYCK